MKRPLSLLPIALIAVTLTGCVEDKSGPSVSSHNPRERRQAVRQAQEKWGARQREKTANQEAIIGCWNHPWTNTTYMLFNADGTFKRVSLLITTKGTYRLLSNDVIEMDYQGILGRWEFKYRLVGDTLEIKDGNFITYTRAAK
ncbi:MAG: hypothetical protein ACRELG_16125 [Gemmataceae bacterium]